MMMTPMSKTVIEEVIRTVKQAKYYVYVYIYVYARLHCRREVCPLPRSTSTGAIEEQLLVSQDSVNSILNSSQIESNRRLLAVIH